MQHIHHLLRQPRHRLLQPRPRMPRRVGRARHAHDPKRRRHGKDAFGAHHFLPRVPTLVPHFLKVLFRNQVPPIRQRRLPILHQPLQARQHPPLQHLNPIQHAQLSLFGAFNDPFVLPIRASIATGPAALEEVARGHFLVAVHRLASSAGVAHDRRELLERG